MILFKTVCVYILNLHKIYYNTSINAKKTLKMGKILQNSKFLSQPSLQKIISGMAHNTNFLQTYLESADSPLLETVETSARYFHVT